jgi:hypothetical protein
MLKFLLPGALKRVRGSHLIQVVLIELKIAIHVRVKYIDSSTFCRLFDSTADWFHTGGKDLSPVA